MERESETFDVDTIRYNNRSWESELFQDGTQIAQSPVHIGGYSIDFDGPVTVTFDEYFTKVSGDMKITVSWVQREYEGEPYTEDHRIEQVEVFE